MEENKNNEIKMNSEVKQTNAQQVKTKKKSKVVPVLVTIILILVLALALCIGNMYAMTNDYDNVFAMIGNMAAGEEVIEEENESDNVVENNEEIKENNSNVVEEKEQSSSEEEVQSIIQGFLNIMSSNEAGSVAMLQIEEIGLIKDYEEWSQISNTNEKDKEGYVKTDIKYSDLKNKMLNYMSDELFKTHSNSYKNVNDTLWVLETGASGYTDKVENIKKISSNEDVIIYEVSYTRVSFNDAETNQITKFELQKNANGKYAVSDWGWNMEVKESLQNYLDLAGAYEGSPSNLLVKLNLLKAEDINYFDADTDSEGFVKTNIKYSDYKEAMLNYVSESWFNERFTSLYKEKSGYLYYHNGGGTGRETKVENIGKFSDDAYDATVYNIGVDGDKSDTYNIKFNVKTYNEKYVISYYK